MAGRQRGAESVECRAVMVGEGLDVRALAHGVVRAAHPLTVPVGDGYAVLFRFGVVVLFGLSDDAAEGFVRGLGPHARAAEVLAQPERVSLRIDPAGEDGVRADGAIVVRELDAVRIQLVAEALAKSLILEHYEVRLARVFDDLLPTAEEMRGAGHSSADAPALLRQIGSVIVTRHQMVGRVEVAEKPELLWDHPQLERFYGQLAAEFDILDRDRALARKLDVIADTAELLLTLVHNRRSMRVEWYIVVLIVIEILLTLYQLFHAGIAAA